MGKWVHRLTNLNKIEKTAICASCGPVKVKQYNKNRFGCANAALKWVRYTDGSLYSERPKPKGQTCEICGTSKNICYDHNHNTNLFRGWLCNEHNLMLGFAKDDIKVLEKAIAYLAERT